MMYQNRKLFIDNDTATWDFDPHRKRILMLKEVGSPAEAKALPSRIDVILDWVEKRNKRVPVDQTSKDL